MNFARQLLWGFMQEMGNFSAEDLNKKCQEIEDYSLYSIRRYLRDLTRAGYLQYSLEKGVKIYWLAKSFGIHAPINEDGEIYPPNEERRLDAYNRMWTTMRIWRSFTTDDISMCAEVSNGITTVYVSQLIRAGFLQVVRKGRKGAKTIYRLMKDTGPIAPRPVRKKAIFDFNTKVFYGIEKEGIANVS